MAAVTLLAPRSLDEVRDPGGPAGYPTDRLYGLDSALVLFAARWFGRQDAYWIHDNGLEGTCVDVDGERLDAMRGLYPDGWEFHRDDAFEFSKLFALAGRQWDVVSLDPHTGLFDRCAELTSLWCRLARELVILGTGVDTRPIVPDGWELVERRQRSTFRGGVYWTVLQPC